MSKVIGIIAEDNSDIAVIENILTKYVPRNSFSIKRFVGNGCGKLRKNCRSWTETLFRMGCAHVVILHDLDRNDLNSLRRFLESKVDPATFPNSVIVIPIEELEAWLLTDELAIQQVFNLSKPFKRIANTETISSPKEHLRNLIWTKAKRKYLNTVHNQKIAAAISLVNIKRCKSFLPFDNYVRRSIFNL